MRYARLPVFLGMLALPALLVGVRWSAPGGSAAGSTAVLVKDIWLGLNSSSPNELTDVNGTLPLHRRCRLVRQEVLAAVGAPRRDPLVSGPP